MIVNGMLIEIEEEALFSFKFFFLGKSEIQVQFVMMES
jgi:hypothetical protein